MIVRGLKFFTCTLFVVLLFVLIWQVFSRYVLKDPSTVTEELSRLLLVWLGTSGTALGFLTREHLAFDLFVQKQKPKTQKRMQELADLGVIFFGLIMLVGGGFLFWTKLSLEHTTAVLKIPSAWVILVLPLSGIFVMLSPFIKPPQKDN